MKRVFSGIQPSGDIHIGNYIGAIRQWIDLQNESSALYCIVDLHALTVYQDPRVLRKSVLDSAALYLACGLDPERMHLFVQSDNPDHTYLSWILNCVTPYGQLQRMTQFKDKSSKQQENTTAGLFDYPVLMAADILLYDTHEVPVGDDQRQHIELARDIVERFNHTYGNTFRIPKPRILSETARIMSLLHPEAKMSKSDENQDGVIYLLDDADTVSRKIRRAVTDSGDEVRYDPVEKPAISNLLVIFHIASGKEIPALEKEYSSSSYAAFKKDLADAVVSFLEPIQSRYSEIRGDEAYLLQVLDSGAFEARRLSAPKIAQVRDAVGVGR